MNLNHNKHNTTNININNPTTTNPTNTTIPNKTKLHYPQNTTENITPKNPNEIKQIDKMKKPRLVLDDKTLLYNENGIKKLYDTIDKTKFKSNDTSNLNILMQIFKNWHFMLFPKYDINLFTAKLTDIGKKSSGRAYMSRLRKIYKGEETWDVMYNEQDMIISTKKGNIANVGIGSMEMTSPYKVFREDNEAVSGGGLTLNFNKSETEREREKERDNISNISYTTNNNKENSISGVPVNRISNKLSNVTINNVDKKIDNDNRDKEETDIQEMYFEMEKDYENFEHIYDDMSSINKGDEARSVVESVTAKSACKSMKSINISEYKYEKRNFTKAFGESSMETPEKLTKKMKFDSSLKDDKSESGIQNNQNNQNNENQAGENNDKETENYITTEMNFDN